MLAVIATPTWASWLNLYLLKNDITLLSVNQQLNALELQTFSFHSNLNYYSEGILLHSFILVSMGSQ